MPSKKSKPNPKRNKHLPTKRPLAWKAELTCSDQSRPKVSESQLSDFAAELAALLQPGDRVLLEGPMGAGKTTFARALLQALGVRQPPEGSPTFAIAHEYELKDRACSAVHIDFYRIRAESEIEERGLPDYFWDPGKIVISEWTSLWPEFEKSLLKSDGSSRNWGVTLAFETDSDAPSEFRQLQFRLLSRQR